MEYGRLGSEKRADQLAGRDAMAHTRIPDLPPSIESGTKT